jgi:hypothetical protein
MQRRLSIVPLLALGLSAQLFAQAPRHITSPKEQFGFNIGDDYRLVNYTQLEAYWKKLASESDRVKLVDIGTTAEGRHTWMAIITSPENHKNLAHYKEISQKLAAAEGVTADQAHTFAREGKAVVWIDGGLHATEVAGSQQLLEMVYQMLTRTDVETIRLLSDDILLCVPANPDGQELVANWYMREKDETRRTMNGLPRLYNKYIGHDDNRDSLTSNMPETANMNRQLFIEWNPQLMYNHHQSGPAGEVIFIPPLRDPVNHNVDPLVTLGIQAVGTALHERLVAQGKGGSGMRTQANYDGWWNGGMRNTATFHNTIALLTEIIGNPTPMEIPLIPEKQLYISDLPLPIAPQAWHFRQTIDYLMETNRAMLDYASRNRERLLYNIWRMGMNSIERGSKDYWTITPKRIEALRAAAGESGPAGRGGRGAQAAAGGGDTPGGGFGARGVSAALYEKVLHDPKMRDPRGYIIPSDQPDFPTATRFVNTMLKSGITVLQASAKFDAAGKTYPAGSYVVKTAQAFRPMIRDDFEPQDHPRDDLFPGGPPIPPYDIAGWTLAMQMGVEYDRILDQFDGPFVRLNGLQKPYPRSVTGPASPAGYLISHRSNYSFVLVNRLLKANAEVYWVKSDVKAGAEDLGTGAIWVPASAPALPVLRQGANDLGVAVHAVTQAPSGDAFRIPRVRIGLYDQYGGLMPSGWTRWLFEQYEFPFEVVYPQTLDAGDLKSRFDVLVFPDGAARGGAGGRGGGRGGRGGAADPQDVPEEYRGWLGRITEEKTIPQIKRFVESGGAVVTVGSSTSLAEMLGVPVYNALTEKGADGQERALTRDKFYIPGSLMKANIDNANPLAYGMPETADVFFDNNPVFRLPADAKANGVTPVAWFSGKETLDSGWALGQQLLDGATAVLEAKKGEGKVFVMGPEVTFRGEPDGTFKLLFNGLFYGAAKPVTLR